MTPAKLATMTDARRYELLREIAALFGLGPLASENELLDAIKDTRERAYRYDDLCR